MRDLITPTEFEAMLIARVKALRELSNMTSAQMAEALGIPAERYRKYESRTPLPHALVERFSLIVRQPVAFVLTGRRVKDGGPYPDVPGPHCLDEWRTAALNAQPSKRGRKPKTP